MCIAGWRGGRKTLVIQLNRRLAGRPQNTGRTKTTTNSKVLLATGLRDTRRKRHRNRATSTIRINTVTIRIIQAIESVIDSVQGTPIIRNIPIFDQVQHVKNGVAQASLVATLLKKVELSKCP